MNRNREAITVTALNRYVRTLLENDEVLSHVWVEGELSDVHIHLQSGHIYFKVIDNNSSVRAVMFRSYAERLGFIPKDGMKVFVSCKITLYEKGGDYQLNAYDIVEVGLGKRQEQLDELKKRLAAEGLFDPARKRKLPVNPDRISVITSATGSVIRDIQNVCSRRNPFVELILYPVYVQGLFAVDAIIDAINTIKQNTLGSDLVIIARGGGSTDDLWIFNDERLVRAACSLPIPFVSAVGHETDFSLLDFGADMRVPTPSAGAEISVPDISLMLNNTIYGIAAAGTALKEQLSNRESLLEEYIKDLGADLFSFFNNLKSNLSHTEKTLESLSPLNILSRGYAYITKDEKNISSVHQLKNGDLIDITLSDCEIACVIDEFRHTNEQ